VAPSKRILVIEDDPDILNAVAESLVLEGYTVATATNGQDALELAGDARPDAIVLDLMLPIMDGRTFLARCRTQPGCRDVPIVVISASHALRAAAEPLREFGVDAVLRKPFDLGALIGTIQRFAPLAST
jgi:CheY-like chemotaxis protein